MRIIGSTHREDVYAPHPIDTAVILAAGLGTRLDDLKGDGPKGFVHVAGRSLIERSLDNLWHAGITRVFIGTGYRAEWYERLADADPRIRCVHSPRFASTGSMYTLYALRHTIDAPFVLLESDLLYEPRALELVRADPRPDVVLASDATHSGDEVFIETDATSDLVAMSKDATQLGAVDAELVGITKISLETYRDLCAVMASREDSAPKLDYEAALVEVGRAKPIRVLRADGLVWCEIDDAHHLERAKDVIWPRVAAALAPSAPPRRRAAAM